MNTPDTPGEFRMTRGHPPVVAIAEAMHYAVRLGYRVSGVHALRLSCDFMAISEGKITLVRVRRLRYARYGLPDIVASCTQEILELPEHAGRRRHRSRALGQVSGQALAPVCHFSGPDRSNTQGDAWSLIIPASGTSETVNLMN